MRILFFSTYFYPYVSGITTYPLKVLKHLSKKNQITVLTFRHSPELKSIESKNGIKLVRIPYLFKFSKGFFSPQSLTYFLRYIKKTDLVILNIPNFEGFPLALISKIYQKKITSVFLCEVYLGKEFMPKIINFFLNLSVYFQLFLSNIIVTLTKDYIDNLNVGKFFKNKIRVSLPPIEKLTVEKKMAVKFTDLKGKNIWIGYAGRIAKEKGLEYLIKAVARIKFDPDFIGTKFEIVFAGPYGRDVAGENQYYLKIKHLLDQYKIPYRFFGNLNDKVLAAFYKSIDLLVLASVNKTEAFGMVQAEAMLLGTPVIASNLPGVRIPIKLTKMGEVVEPKNITQLSQAIEKILKNKNNYSNELLIKKSQNIFNIQKTYKFYDNLIFQLQ